MEINEIHSEHEHATTSLKVVLLVFAIVLVGALAYLVWAANTAPDTTDNSSAVIKKTTAVSTADWKTYTNAEHGYSIKYPKDWVEVKDGGDDIVLLSAERNAGIKNLAGQAVDSTPSLRVSYYASPNDLQTTSGEKSNATSLLGWLKSESQKKGADGQPNGWVTSYKNKVIAGYSGYDVDEPNIGGINFWYIENNGHVYAFQFDETGSEEVIGTFKLTK